MYHEKSLNQVNSIAIDRNEYDSEKEFKKAVKKAVMFLIDNGYVATVKYDSGKELGVVVINYEYDRNYGFGNALPYWLTPLQFEEYMEMRKERKHGEGSC